MTKTAPAVRHPPPRPRRALPVGVAPRRQRAAGQRRGRLPARRRGARRPPAPDPGRRDRPALGLDPVAVPGVQRAAAVRGRPARRRHLPHAAEAAPARRRDAERELRQPRLRRHRDRVLQDVRAAQARRRDPRRTAASSSRCRRRWRRSARSWTPSSRRALEPVYEARVLAELERHPGRDPARPARDPVGHALRVRDARGRRAGVVQRGARRDPGAAAAARAATCPPASSSASTSATATRRTATSSRRATAASWSRSPTRCRPASGARWTGSTCRCRATTPTTPTSRRWRDLRAAAADRALPRRPSRRRRRAARASGSPPRAATSTASASATDCGWGRGGPRRSTSCSRCTARCPRRCRRRCARSGRGAFAWPEGFVPVPDEEWTDAADRRHRARLRPRRRARLVLEPRPERRGDRRVPARRRRPDGLLGRHRASCSTACGCGSSSARSAG